MENIKNELDLIKQYGEDYYRDTMSYLEILINNERYDLFERCFKYINTKYNGVIRWEYLFEKILDAFTNHNFDELIDNIIKSDNKQIDIDKVCSILLQQKNDYNLNSVYDIYNSVSIKSEVLNKIYQTYEESNDVYVIYEIINKYDIVDKKIIDNIQLLQNLIFEKCFNLNYREAKSLIDTYGKNISNVKGIDKSLILLINNLKEVINIKDEQTLKEIFKNSLYSDIDILNYDIIDRILSTSYSNIYNQTNYHPNKKDLIGQVNGKIPVYEIGNEFYMNVYSLGGVFPNNTNEYKNDWDSRRDLFISTSYIGNTNMNTCNINNVCYGFCSFNANDVLDVGFKNVFVSNGCYINPESLYRNYMKLSVINVQYAMPQEFLQESKKEQWNEIGYRRFTEDGKRIYPDYIVYFSDGQINQNDKIWLNSVKAATEFSIPIVVINRKRINEYNASVTEQKEFVPQQAVTFDSTKLSTAMEHFNSVINQRKSANSNVPNNINRTNESRDNKMEELINQRKELNDRIKIMEHQQKTQNINVIRNTLGVTFTDSYYSMGGQDVNSPPSITYKTLKELQQEYTRLDLKLREKLDDNEITTEQCIIASKALSALYNEYKRDAVYREKQAQQSKSTSSNNNSDDEYNPNKTNAEQTDSFENIRSEARRNNNYDNMTVEEKKSFDRKIDETIKLRKQRNAYRERFGYEDMTDAEKKDFDKSLDEMEKVELAVRYRLIDQGIEPDQLLNLDELVKNEREKMRLEVIEEIEQVERRGHIK